MTRTKEEGDLEVVEGPGQEPGAVGVAATSDPSVAPLRLGEAERGIAGTSGAEDAAYGDQDAALGVLPRAAPGRVEPSGGENPLGGPQPHRGEGQSAAEEEQAAAPRQGATESEGEWEEAGPPLVEEPLGKGEACGTERAAGRQGALWGHAGDLGEEAAMRLGPGEGPALGGAGCKREARMRGHRVRGHRGRRRQGRRRRDATKPTTKTAWEWILLAWCLWSALQVGAALVLKGTEWRGRCLPSMR